MGSPMLTELPLPPEAASLLDALDGLVLDFALFKHYLPEGEPPVDVLRRAARRTVERALESGNPRSPNSLVDRNPVGAIDERLLAAAAPELVSWEEFLGPWWDGDWKCLRPRDDPTTFANPPHGNGYAYAFSNPPYPIRATPKEVNHAFTRATQRLLGAPIGDRRVRIWRWPTDWSRYFNDGHEWWGSYCWTLWMAPERIVGITGSFTD